MGFIPQKQLSNDNKNAQRIINTKLINIQYSTKILFYLFDFFN